MIQIIGIVAFALNVWGNLELTRQTNRGHIIRLAANACWIIYSPLVGAWALLGNHLVFAGINVLGYKRWHRIQHLRTQADRRRDVADAHEETARFRVAFEAGQRAPLDAYPEHQFDAWMASQR